MPGKLWLAVWLLLAAVAASGQNDACSNAAVIALPAGGFGTGTVSSATGDFSSATVQGGESFAAVNAAAGQDQKSLWYRFSLPTTRSVQLRLVDAGGLAAGDAGFAVYRNAGCLPAAGSLSTELPAVSGMMSSSSCLKGGDYLVQVAARGGVTGKFYLLLTVNTVASLFDTRGSAYDFGVISSSQSSKYAVGCQSVDDAGDLCTGLPNYTQYNKSSWHVFTTKASFQGMAMTLLTNAANQRFGLRLYQGNVLAGGPLTVVTDCEVLQADAAGDAIKVFPCGSLSSNTSYSLEIFFYQDFTDDNVFVGMIPTTSSTENVYASICAGSSYTLRDGTVVTAGGMYTTVLPGTGGCGSLTVNTTLTVEPVKIVNSAAATCGGSPYTLPWGQTVSSSGIYRDTLRSAGGCDSVIRVVDLAVGTASTQNINASICAGGSYILPSGAVVNAAGIYKDTLRSVAGCDSLIRVVDLSVGTVSTQTINASICAGGSYILPSGAVVNAAGVYKDTLRSVAGCDSLIRVVDLAIGTASTQNIPASICAGGSYILPSGAVVNAAGVYKDTLRSVAGCDSVIRVVDLAVGTVNTQNIPASICAGGSYILPSGAVVNVAGVYKDTLRSVAGCDSLIRVVDLAVGTASTQNIAASICAGGSYTLPWGTVVNTAGVYRDTLRSVAGCDSVIRVIDLSVGTASTQNIAASICAGGSYILPSGAVVNVVGIYKDTLRSVAGCDSVIRVVDLAVGTVSTQHINASICAGSSYTLPSGTVVNTAGVYRDTLRAVAGCDSLIRVVDLSVGTASTQNINASICAGGSYILPSGAVVNAAGVYKDTLRSVAGCDSLIRVVDLAVGTASTQTTPASICAGSSYILPSGALVNVAGIYKDTLRSVAGCDSVIRVVDLSVGTASTQNINASICAGGSYILPSGAVVNAAGVYKDTLRSFGGCDSVIRVVDLSVGTVSTQNIAASICAGGSYILPSGAVVNVAGVYKDTLRSVAGCDSLIRVVDLAVGTVSTQNIAASICAGGSYILPSGTVVNTAGIYKDTLRSVAGCDSVIRVVDLSVGTASTQNIAASICAGGSYILPSGAVVNAAGVYRDTLRSAGGCDSLIRVVDLAVGTVSTQNINASICAGGSYTLPSGITVNTAGVYRDTLRAVAGCDSLIRVVDLSVGTASTQHINASICAGGSYTLPSGITVNTAGVYRDTLRAIAGCDSVIRVVDLSVGTASTQHMNASICAGGSYTLPSGTIVSTAGVYRDTLRAVAGCDSLIRVVDLSVGTVSTQHINASICAGGSYTLPSGTVVNTAGMYRDTLRAVAGCDSLIRVVDLAVGTLSTQNIAASICAGGSYTLSSGAVVNTAGMYQDTLRAVAGCDSVIRVVDLAVGIASTQHITASICAGSSYTLPSGTVVNTAGVYRDTLRAVAGCDSLIRVVDLSVGTASTQNITASICAGGSYTLSSGTVVNTAGVYRDTLRAIAGCDSVIRVVDLSVGTASTQHINASICAGSSYTLPSGTVVNTAGVYRDTLRAVAGCDSVIRVVDLSVGTFSTQNIAASICAGGSYTLLSGIVVNTAGVYRDTLRALAGCDSVIRVVDLSVGTASTQNIPASICAGSSYTLPSGAVVNTAGVYRDTLRAVAGCDSVIRVVDLSVGTISTQHINASICAGSHYTLPWGTVVNTAGVYRDTLRAVAGCDSVIRVVDLSVISPVIQSLSATLAPGSPYVLPWGTTVNTAGVYRDTVQTANGCDSLVLVVTLSASQVAVESYSASSCAGTDYLLPWGVAVQLPGIYRDTLRTAGGTDSLLRVVTLRVLAAPVISLRKSNDLDCSHSSARLEASGGTDYRWWPATGLTDTSGSRVIASPPVSTLYHVQVSNAAGCVSEDSILVAIREAIDQDYLVPSAFTPNHDGLNDCFHIRHWGNVTHLRFSVFNRWGQLVFQTNQPGDCWDGSYQGQALPTGSFVYIIQADTGCGPITRKGSVMLIR